MIKFELLKPAREFEYQLFLLKDERTLFSSTLKFRDLIKKITAAEDYNSHNTQRLDVVGMQELLLKLSFMQSFVRNENVSPEE